MINTMEIIYDFTDYWLLNGVKEQVMEIVKWFIRKKFRRKVSQTSGEILFVKYFLKFYWCGTQSIIFYMSGKVCESFHVYALIKEN